MEETFKNLLKEAKIMAERAYAPYSFFPVGACVLYENGKIYKGCNVENASYGLSLCAERNAISSAIAEGETSKIKAIAIYSPAQVRCMPCGACRQWISEFCISEDDTKIILEDKDDTILVLRLKDIFPYSFKMDEQ